MFTWPTLCLESPQALLTGRADVYMADALPRVTTGTADRKGRSMFTWPTLCLESPQALPTGRADVYMADALPRVPAGTADRKGRCLHGRRSA